MQIVWQSPNFPDNGWRTQKFDVLANNSNARPGVTKTGNDYGGQQIKVLLSEVFGASYNNYLAAEDNIRIVLQYYGSGSGKLADLDIQEAYLLISSVPVAGNTSAPGLMTQFGLGDTTIRNSANEYGWKFTVKKDGKLPKGFSGDVAALRDATHFFFVSKEGGFSPGNGVSTLVGYEQLSIILEAGGNSHETILYNEDIIVNHADESVIFAIELDKLTGYASTIGAKVTAADLTSIKPPAGYALNDYKYKNVNVILKYASAFENLGLVAGYIITDTDEDATAGGDFDALISTGTALEYTFKGISGAGATKEFGYIKGDSTGAIKNFLKTKNIALPSLMATIEEKKGSLGDFTLKNSDSQFVWGFNGVDGNLPVNTLVNAKYLVIETKGSARTDGFGGTRVVTQSHADWGWNANNNNPWGDFVSFAHTASETVYIVIDVTTLAGWATGVGVLDTTDPENGGKIIIQHWNVIDFGIRDAYLISAAQAGPFAKANFDAKDKTELGVSSTGGDPNGNTALDFYITKDTAFTTALDTLYGR
jgi:hypothetical protein